ncbi:MAG TPA: class I tRNA ligase family protein [Chitinophagaceae bacterium]
MEYRFRDIEKKWQQWWNENKIYKVSNDSAKPKYYVLDMFPYPSGAGLHVGHPLGYIASDIYARFKRLKGFNVLHPMGYDAFGLPAEQYAIEHGIHPAVSTENNINNFRKQLDNIGFCFDWDREVRTSEPKFYKWTQWIFLRLFDSFYNRQNKKAEPISNLIAAFEIEGNKNHPIPDSKFEARLEPSLLNFSAKDWKSFDGKKQQNILMEYRLAYCGYGEVNWCEALGTVLANDEVINGVSERGGHPVVKKKLRQWYLRITEYADRLLEGLQKVDFSESMKEMQSNWIGKSSGAEIDFEIEKPPLTPPKGEQATPRYETAFPSLYNITKKLAEEKRHDPTHEEEIMWGLLRANKAGFHIRRQHIIGSYIVDFACLDKLATIEIDGGYHDDPVIQQYDKERTRFLKENGFTEIRFTNEEVRKDAHAVIVKLTEILSQLPSVPRKSESSKVSPSGGDLEGALTLRVYTTRPDTIFGVDFMVIAPEHELVEEITTSEQKRAVDEYIAYVKSRSERERMAEKKISGVFTGSYALNPFDGRAIPIWISEYVLIGYGTGAIMAVPCGDQRDFLFAKHFNIPITNIIGNYYNGEEANPTKDAILENSGFINGMVMKDAIDVVINKLEEMGIGIRKVNYKMRDAAFSRQRYWGEPFPIIWKDEVAYPLDESELPVELPHMDELKPGEEAEGPLWNLKEWKNYKGGIREVNTMPGYAGSSWYFLRYMDPDNNKEFCSRKASDYWGQVDLYIGGTEHAVGHLLYSRMWTKFLFDIGLISHEEPYKRLVNQGMIVGSSRLIKRIQLLSHDENILGTAFISMNRDEFTDIDGLDPAGINKKLVNLYFPSIEITDIKQHSFSLLHVDVNIVDGNELDVEEYKKWKPEYIDAKFVFEDDGSFLCYERIEKMSKRYFNTVNPNSLCEKYGADTFRMYEMFLGPVEMSKPWDTKGIEGVHRFLKKLWRLFFDDIKGPIWTTASPSPSGEGKGEAPTDAELKALHKTIKKIEEDTERFSFNTGVSTFMICVNELTDLKCHKKEILEPLLILLAPYAPHIAEELYAELRKAPSPSGEGGGEASILDAEFPKWNEKYLKETSKAYPVAINGKTRTELTLALDATQQQVEEIVLKDAIVTKWLEGKQPKKIIYVKNKMINVVV